MNDEAAKPETSALKNLLCGDPAGEIKRYRDGLQAIQTVLDYATDSAQTRYNIAVWTKDAIDALLRGEVVVEPSRKAL